MLAQIIFGKPIKMTANALASSAHLPSGGARKADEQMRSASSLVTDNDFHLFE
jgi:hypothetical protein